MINFTGVDTQFNDDVLSGTADDDRNILTIESNDAYTLLIKKAQDRRGGEMFETIDQLISALPRLEIGFDKGGTSIEPDSPPEAGEIVKVNKEKKQVFGWAYVTHDKAGDVVVDKSGEFIEEVEVLENAAYDFVVTSRRGGVEHERSKSADEVVVKSSMIESVVFTPDKIREMGIPANSIPQGAWWVGFQINDDDVWESYKDGTRTSFSIHGKGVKKAVEE